MARINNAITFGAGFNISAASPIDSRMRVQYESDLTNAATWNSSEAPLYDGLTTTVMETGDIWVLMDKTKYTDKTTGQGWVNKGKGSEIDDNSSANNKTWSAEKISTELSGKQNTLTAGANIVITNDTISAVIDAGFSVEVVQSLPASGETNTIYFVPISGGTTPDVYDEYMYINNAWEKIGSTEVDLSNYYNKTEVDTLLSGKQATLTASDNIDITNNAIKAVGYRYDTSNGAFAEGDRDIVDSGTTYAKSNATGRLAHAEGRETTASGNSSHSEGYATVASGNQGHAEGWFTKATAGNAHAEGRAAEANGLHSHSEGNSSKTNSTAESSHAEGYSSETGGNYTSNTKTAGVATDAGAYAHAEGNSTIANGIGAHSEGRTTLAKGNYSHAEGNATIANGTQSHTEGSSTEAKATNAHAEGRLSVANGYASHTEGDGSETGGNYATATTNTKTADSRTTFAGDYAHAEGLATIAYGVASHTEGQKTFAKGNYSHAEGYETIVLENAAHAEGSLTKVNVSANGSHVEGYNTETGGNRQSNDKTANTTSNAGAFAHAEGNSTIAQGVSSHSEGRKTFAKGTNSHAEGVQTVANGTNSHAEGTTTVANGGNSHAEGRFTQTLQNAEHAQGSYNLSHTDDTADGFGTNGSRTIHSIGIGTADDARKNAVEVMQNGDAYLLGVGGYDGMNLSGDTLQTIINSKQGTLTAGTNIEISNGTISAVGYSYDTTKGNLTQICQDETANVNTAQKNNVCLGENNSITGAETEASTIVGGYGNTVTGSACVVGGFGCSASGTSSVAMGYETSANGFNTAFGYRTQATAQGAFAAGNGTRQKALIASGWGAAAFGKSSLSSGEASFAAGDNVTASAQSSQAFGNGTVASGNQAFAEGYGTVASGLDSHVEGSHTEAAGSMQHVQGKYNIVDNNSTYADIIGNGTADNARSNAYTMTWAGKSWFADDVTSGGTNATPAHVLSNKQDALTAGDNISISGNTISAEGYSFDSSTGGFAEKYKQLPNAGGQIVANTANTLGAHAEGYNTTSSNYGSHSEGYSSTASGVASHAEGNSTNASGNGSHAEGKSTTASAIFAHAEGQGTTASGGGAHAEGLRSTASNTVAHAEGEETLASGAASHSEGKETTASALCSHAEGYSTTASYDCAHSEGNQTTASGNASHTEGFKTLAEGECSHAEGFNTSASGDYGSHSEGWFTMSLNNAEHSEGIYNISHTGSTIDVQTIHSIGIGSSNARQNALEVMQNADVYIKGVGNYDGIHIKGEISGMTVYTLQEVIAVLQSQVASLDARVTALEPQPTYPARNQIWYETVNGQISNDLPNYVQTVGSGQCTNVYENGKGVITYASDIYSLQYWPSEESGEEDWVDNIKKVWLPYFTEAEEQAGTADINFLNCLLTGESNLTDVYYPGTMDELEHFCWPEEGANEWECLRGSGTNVIHCSDGDRRVRWN